MLVEGDRHQLDAWGHTVRFIFSDPENPAIIEGMCRWTGIRIGASFDPATAKGISVLSKNGAATVLYTDYRKVDIRMHVAGVGRWLSRTALAVWFGYPFQELGVRRVTGLVARKNKKARQLNEDLGFTLEGKLREAMENGDDMMLYGMLRKECRWLKESTDGQRQQRA